MFKYIALGLIAIVPNIVSAQKTIKINGAVADTKVDSFGIVNITQTSIAAPKIVYVKPDATGNFSVSLPNQANFNTIAVIYNDQHTTFLAPAKEKVNVSLSLKDNLGVTYIGAKKNSVAAAHEEYNLAYGGLNMVQNQIRNLNQTEPAYFNTAYDSLKKIILADLPKNAPSDYLNYLKESIDLYFYNTQLMYAIMKIQRMGQNYNKEAAEPYMQISQKAPKVINDNLLHLPIYQEYIVNYALYQYVYANVTTANDANANITNAVKTMKAYDGKKSAAFAIAKLLQMAKKGIDQNVWSNIAKDLIISYPNDANAILIKNEIDELEKFNPGKKAIDFEFTTLEGERKKLSDYKGKVVYLDFWASWCGPCRQQMPYAKEVKKHFEGKDVVFLYVSIDDTDEKWLNGIKSMQVEGVQTRSGGWGGDLPRKYNISSIPAYFLIDKDGNFAASPPRPSQKYELIGVIEALLNK